MISRYASRGSLNVPYGLVIRQDGLLVANRGSGTVTKYTTKSFFSNDTGSTVLIGEFETPIQTPCGGILLNDGIWGLALQVSDHDNAQIFFTAAINAGTLATVTTAPVDGLVGVFITANEEEEEEEKESSKRVVLSSSKLKHTQRIQNPKLLTAACSLPQTLVPRVHHRHHIQQMNQNQYPKSHPTHSRKKNHFSFWHWCVF